MTWYDAIYFLALLLLSAAAGHAIGYRSGAKEENRLWRFAATTEPRERLNQYGRDFIVMERSEFWEQWRDPLIRLRRQVKP